MYVHVLVATSSLILHLPLTHLSLTLYLQVSSDIAMVVRTTIHAIQRRKDGTHQFLSVATLNEWDPKVPGNADYKKLIDTQRGNLLAMEIKNNSAKLAKFTLGALLAGADSMRLGLIARNARTDPDAHNVLGTHTIVPTTFASQLALSLNNAWAIVRWLVDTVRKHAKNLQDVPDEEYIAKFVLMRDPNKAAMRLYNVPTDAFDRPEEGAADDEEWGAAPGAEAGAGDEVPDHA